MWLTLNLQYNQRTDRAGAWREYATSVHRRVFPLYFTVFLPQRNHMRRKTADNRKTFMVVEKAVMKY